MGDRANPCRKDTEAALQAACKPVGKPHPKQVGRTEMRRILRQRKQEARRKAIAAQREEWRFA